MMELVDYGIVAGIVAVFGAAGQATVRAAEAARLARLEAKLDALLRHSNVSYVDPASPEGLSEEVKSLANDPTKRIEAIKLLREQTGLGLKDAKDAVDRYVDRKV
jgi:ribosomal protein L7/L12